MGGQAPALPRAPGYDYHIPLQAGTLRAERTSQRRAGENVAAALAPAMARITAALESLEGRGWEIVSHDIVPAPPRLVLSVVICRPKR
jgi:hypothetical protein